MENKLLMQSLAKAQQEVHDTHDHASNMMKQLQIATNDHKALMGHFRASIDWAKEKQNDRKKLMSQKQALWLEVRSLRVRRAARIEARGRRAR
eukprot:1017770-Prymnesium_polylepis.1